MSVITGSLPPASLIVEGRKAGKKEKEKEKEKRKRGVI